MPVDPSHPPIARNETTNFNYMTWQDIYKAEKPFQVLIDIPEDAPDQRRTNVEFQPGPDEIVHDVRGQEHSFKIDSHGFEYIKAATSLGYEDFSSSSIVKKEYVPECVALLKRVIPDAERVHVFGWRKRKSGELPTEGQRVDFGSTETVLGPATAPHVDQSPRAVVEMVKMRFPDEADKLLSGRVRIINIWRPINGPVHDWPLAVADATTVKPSSLIEVDRIRMSYHGPTYFLTHQDGVKWYYASEQKNDEVLFLKIFDSEEGVAKYCVHSSFKRRNPPPDAPVRESIEIRTLVFSS
ncbi:hypothetical protein QBC34DRAFT_29322 [Podospora aff. communis PSN243]|uniref:Methyltransferase n=1 Tax=Podospora aff. communis PSN243 TaxID=3040156 RepID=A0AAV9GUY2_9PEZI|nr:hypothetical protein QBC34DRAFT_29322 [Podospora aff. communis PSN243]